MAVLNSILEVFSSVGEWIAEAVTALIPMFYNANPAEGEAAGLTFLGVLAVAGLAISVVFLIIGVIQNFLHFRG